MKKIKYIIIGFILGIIVIGSISVYAVTAVIESKEVSYDNKESHGNYTNVQGSIDELYKRSGVMKDIWVDPILHGADPVIGEGMIPVTIDDNGTVHYANLYTKWYEYETKRWANAVILVDSEKEKYKTGDTIPESAIESYFVWIPRYKYKIWDLGNYTSAYSLVHLKDTEDSVENDDALRRFNNCATLIDIVFETKNITPSKEEELGSYYTHPAFTLGEKNLNGLWIGKFEVSKNNDNIQVKPNAFSWHNETVGTFWNALFSYKNTSNEHNPILDPHMMKNTEWGAVAYLSHSVYGIGTEVNINNNSEYKTGYSAAVGTDQSSFEGETGTSEEKTKPWNTPTGYLASTTGNITGIYDMSGGCYEYVAAYIDGYASTNYSGITNDILSKYDKYFDKYSDSSNSTAYNNRILGDATGEIGPFYSYYDKDKSTRPHGWYAGDAAFLYPTYPWFLRGGGYYTGGGAGQFSFFPQSGVAASWGGSRLVLAV